MRVKYRGATKGKGRGPMQRLKLEMQKKWPNSQFLAIVVRWRLVSLTNQGKRAGQ